MSKIGIIGAMELEVEELKSAMTVSRIVKKAKMEFYEGTLNGASVVIVRSGIGKVNAALCTQILVDLFDVTHIINTGVAGSLNASLDIGDILISRDALHHDVDVTIFGYKPGEVPQIGVREFVADEKLVALAKAACEKVNPDVHAAIGRVVSGDQFISGAEHKSALYGEFRAMAAEMEGGAIAQVAAMDGVPFAVVRSISDLADGTAADSFDTFEKHAADASAAALRQALRAL